MTLRAIQVRHVPEAVHRRLKAQAASTGQSLSDYLLAELHRVAQRPTCEEMLARLRALPPVELSKPLAELIAEDRLAR